MAKQTAGLNKFVRLNLIGEIVEVVSFNSMEITIKFQGMNLTMQHDEVSRIPPEEVARKMSLNDGRTEGEFISASQSRDVSSGKTF
jgi:hypothetical protein